MCWTAIAGLAGSLIAASSAKKAANTQAAASRRQEEQAREIYDLQDAHFAPYREGGQNALNAYNFEMGLGDAPAGYGGFQATPGYDFRMSEGQRALDGSAAMNGDLFSGSTLKAVQGYGQNTATAEYGNYMNRLSGLAGSGQAAAAQTATAAGNMGMVQNQAIGAGTNAQAAGYIGVGNALNAGIGNAIGAYQYQQVTNPGGGYNVGGPNSLFGGNSWG